MPHILAPKMSWEEQNIKSITWKLLQTYERFSFSFSLSVSVSVSIAYALPFEGLPNLLSFVGFSPLLLSLSLNHVLVDLHCWSPTSDHIDPPRLSLLEELQPWLLSAAAAVVMLSPAQQQQQSSLGAAAMATTPTTSNLLSSSEMAPRRCKVWASRGGITRQLVFGVEWRWRGLWWLVLLHRLRLLAR